jgi:predicted 3-demethylubiquinone-9 3-methyltransferase (glyoxalase superfamily)
MFAFGFADACSENCNRKDKESSEHSPGKCLMSEFTLYKLQVEVMDTHKKPSTRNWET